MEQNPLNHYLSRFTPILLPPRVCLTEEDLVRWLIDEGYKVVRIMVKTHYQEDIIRFVTLAQSLNMMGYTMLWFKTRHTVGAQRRVDGSILEASAGVAN